MREKRPYQLITEPAAPVGGIHDVIKRAVHSTKELVKNKSSISCEFGNSAVVPFGQVIVKDDFHVLFEIGSVFTPGLVHLVQNPHRHA